MEFIELILINKLDGVILKYPHHDNVDGTVCITGHHLILSSRKEGVRELWLLHKNIDCIEKKENKPSGGVPQGGSLFLKCKDLKIYQMDIATTPELNLMAQTLENLSSLQNPSLFYPFFYRHMNPIMENGYTLYSVEGEFTKVLATEEWRISRVNQNYTICPGYAKCVVVPKTIDDDVLSTAASFRQGGRFPVLSYRHNNGAVLLRAGQPLYGPKHRRCRADEQLLNAVVGVGMKGVIYDLRSSGAISQQQNKGGGTESNANYSQWRIYNRSMDDVDNQEQLLSSFSKFIEEISVGAGEAAGEHSLQQPHLSCAETARSIHTLLTPINSAEIVPTSCQILKIVLYGFRSYKGTLMRLLESTCSLESSLLVLHNACNDKEISSDKWISKLESCGWPENVRNSLHTACIIAQHIHQKAEPVLIHGTRGEDATLLVSSLVQIILNADCRTIRGLQALVEREWLQAGHPFGARHRCGVYAPPAPRTAPSFALFLDCVRQFLEQFPCSFEYKQAFLITLFEHSYASQFGTFLCDSDQERESRGVYSQTTSIWSWLNQPDELSAYINPLYEPTPTVIWPSVAPMSYVIWEELYLRWQIEQRTELKEEQYRNIRTKEQQLRAQAQTLRRELFDLASQYYGPDIKEVLCDK